MSAWVRTASSVRVFSKYALDSTGSSLYVRTLEAMRTQVRTLEAMRTQVRTLEAMRTQVRI